MFLATRIVVAATLGTIRIYLQCLSKQTWCK
uniref:Uncharacterized protein n=1 Tax=Siphoviridae sp. ctDhw1 TaxID=2827813 RepID=A0A8S5SJL4_9CAUD|nr:MAG TPA: hypothetical protein [Siphoviridae sp. ctDhw1]